MQDEKQRSDDLVAKLSAAERLSADSATKLQQAEDVVRDLTVGPNRTAYIRKLAMI